MLTSDLFSLLPLFLLLVGGILWAVRTRGRQGSSLKSRRAYTTLLRMCLGDRAQVERLLRAEQEYAPGISEREACRRALVRLKNEKR